MPTLTTLSERKSAEAERRKRAARDATDELRAYARLHGGRFIVFGTYVTDAMRFDSDLDIMIDFPPAAVGDAWRFAEDVCMRHVVPLDIHDAATTKPAFTRRILATGMVLA